MADFAAMYRLLQPCLRVPGQDGIVRAQRAPDARFRCAPTLATAAR
jgi:hypothetical protein